MVNKICMEKVVRRDLMHYIMKYVEREVNISLTLHDPGEEPYVIIVVANCVT